jgi:hypothetical protein
MYQQNLDRITREFMAEYARVTAAANDANTNQTSNVSPAPETIVGPSNALLDNTDPSPFISSAPSSYQAAAPRYNPYPLTSTSYPGSPSVAPSPPADPEYAHLPPAYQTSLAGYVEPSRERWWRHHRRSNSWEAGITLLECGIRSLFLRFACGHIWVVDVGVSGFSSMQFWSSVIINGKDFPGMLGLGSRPCPSK